MAGSKRDFKSRAQGRNVDELFSKAQRRLPPPTRAEQRITNAEAGPRAGATAAAAAAAAVEDSSQEEGLILQNGLSDAVGFNSGIPGVPGSGPAVNDTATIFTSLRGHLISNLRSVLAEAYVELGLVQTVVDVPVDDALRGGLTIKTKQLSEDEIAELLTALEKDGDLAAAAQAAKWNRLFGGAGLLVLTDQDHESPLSEIEAGEPVEFRAVDMWELAGYDQDDDTDVEIGADEPEFDDDDFFLYYGKKVHKSRVICAKGIEAPSFIRPRLRGWGVSCVETLVRSINQYIKGTDLGFEVLDEFKLDIFKIKNLTTTLFSPGGTEKIQKRIQLAAWQKNYQNAMVMDSEDDFDHKQLSFAGLGEAMAGIRMQVAADMRMPITKLFGISATGFNSGEDDIEVYNGMVEGQIRGRLRNMLLQVVGLKAQALFGVEPDDLTIEFKSLRVLSGVDEETVKTSKFNRLVQAHQAGLITTRDFRDACNKGGLFDVTLDPDAEDLLLPAAGDPEEDDALKVEPEPQKALPPGAKEEKAPPPKAASVPKPAPTPKPVKERNVNVLSATELQALLLKDAKSAPQPPPWSRRERIERIIKNSSDFDRASYEADGGDKWIHPSRRDFFDAGKAKDKGLWERSASASKAALGDERWQFQVWWYRKQGGKF